MSFWINWHPGLNLLRSVWFEVHEYLDEVSCFRRQKQLSFRLFGQNIMTVYQLKRCLKTSSNEQVHTPHTSCTPLRWKTLSMACRRSAGGIQPRELQKAAGPRATKDSGWSSGELQREASPRGCCFRPADTGPPGPFGACDFCPSINRSHRSGVFFRIASLFSFLNTPLHESPVV